MKTKFEQLQKNATIQSCKAIEAKQDLLTIKRESFNIALVSWLQDEFSSDVQLINSLDSSNFKVIVNSYYWSDYRQEKLDKLEDLLKPFVRSLEVYTDFIPEDENQLKMVFKVTVYHTRGY